MGEIQLKKLNVKKAVDKGKKHFLQLKKNGNTKE